MDKFLCTCTLSLAWYSSPFGIVPVFNVIQKFQCVVGTVGQIFLTSIAKDFAKIHSTEPWRDVRFRNGYCPYKGRENTNSVCEYFIIKAVAWINIWIKETAVNWEFLRCQKLLYLSTTTKIKHTNIFDTSSTWFNLS